MRQYWGSIPNVDVVVVDVVVGTEQLWFSPYPTTYPGKHEHESVVVVLSGPMHVLLPPHVFWHRAAVEISVGKIIVKMDENESSIIVHDQVAIQEL